ncbi:MAG: DUF2789 family protein [Burkholderiaceae bacterium]
MDTSVHDLRGLLSQLGLASDDAALDAFLSSHSLAPGMILKEAPFWSRSQSQFLGEALEDDSDWAEAADKLAMLLTH